MAHHRLIVVEEAAIAQHAFPQLHAQNAENEKDKKTKQQNVAKHGQSVQQEHHQYSHAFFEKRNS